MQLILRKKLSKEIDDYVSELMELRAYQARLGLNDDMPDTYVQVLPGTERARVPVGAKLPVYSTSGEVDEESMKKVMFNLRALLGN